MKAIAKAYRMHFEPIVLKELSLACGITQGELARAVGEVLGVTLSRTTMNLCINRGYIPLTLEGFKEAVEQILSRDSRVMYWLMKNEMTVTDVWSPLGQERRKAQPHPQDRRKIHGNEERHVESGDSDTATVTWEVEMLHPDTMKHFRLFRQPFGPNDVTSEQDIYMSDEHRYIEAAMMDAAFNVGFIAIVGEVQSGKSVIRKKVMENLKREGSVAVIHPRSRRINADEKPQSRVTPSSLCDAIIMGISDQKPQVRTEHKVQQLENLLISRANQGYKHVLIIEEAQNLSPVTLKYLKQFYEIEDGFKKLLGIILIGQPELKDMLDETRHVDIREVIRRIQIVEIKGLDNNLRDYLAFKFKRIGAKVEDIFEESAFEALAKRLTVEDYKKRKISHAYPGLVNSYVTRAMNLVCEVGETKVTEGVIYGI